MAVQRLDQGNGRRHAETADSGSGPTRFVQAWLRPDNAEVFVVSSLPLAELLPRMREGGVGAVTDSGVLGDASGA